MKRKQINAEMRNDIVQHWTNEKRQEVIRRIRATIYREIDFFEKQEEEKIQAWAHKMAQGDKSIIAHADRLDIKASMRKYLRQQIILHLGLMKFFPELFTPPKIDEETNGEKKDSEKTEAETAAN